MKKFFLLITVLSGLAVSAQTSDTKKITVPNRTKDHFMIQYGVDAWAGRPDSVRTGGFSRHFNMYIMFDKPFKTNPKMSLGIGLGLGSSNMFFNNTNVDVKSNALRLPFTIADSINHFNKFKVTTMYLELPVEIRYFSNPNNMNKSWKFAIGAKVGTLLKAYSKGKNYVNRNGQSIYGTSFIEKEQSKKFFNGTSLAVTGRIGYGIIGLQGSYNVLGVLRDGSGATMNRFSVGISISGL
ncbi:MAG: outer membrane beta-barrel protein [Sphingobacteriia bacterium]|jgi:hypothetical protein